MRRGHKFRSGVLVTVTGALALGALHGSVRAQTPVGGAVDETRLVFLKGNTHPLARAEFDRGSVRRDLIMKQMVLLLHNSREQESALQKLLDEQQDPASPNFHKWVTPAQYGVQFGASEAAVQRVTSWLESHGFEIVNVSQGRRQIQFSGTAGQVQATFRTPIHRFVVDGEQHFANTVDPQIPAELTSVVAGVASLHDFRTKPQHHVMARLKRPVATGSAAPVSPQVSLADGSFGLGPSDFATIYNVQPLWDVGIDGTGMTIAIAQRSNIHVSDVNQFRSLFGLPPNPPQVVITNSDPGIIGDETEALLDVEWSGAVAKNATIKMVTSTSGATDGVFLSAQYMVDNNVAPVMSVSYGACELEFGTSLNEFISSLWQQAAAQGQTVLVATADSGSAGCDSPQGGPAQFGLQVNGLASTPYNIAVGGTDFNALNDPSLFWSPTNDPTTQASALSYIPETTWNSSCSSSVLGDLGFSTDPLANCNDDLLVFVGLGSPAGAGGGRSNCAVSTGSSPSTCSQGYSKPSWQAGPGVPNDSARDIPDVSLFSSSGFLGSYYIVCQADQFSGPCDLDTNFLAIGGTSASAPAMAGIMALVNQKTGARQGNANPVFYTLAAAQAAASCNSTDGPASSCVFNDVTDGTIAMPCVAGTFDCSGTGALGYGILTGYSTGVGYDLATGLGSVNAANLINSWPAAVQPDRKIQFAAAAYTVADTGLKATIGVTRLGDNSVPISATWAVTGGTAVLDTDYTQQTGTVTIPAGAVTGSIAFPILHDYDVAAKVAVLSLSDPVGGTLGNPSATALTISSVDTGGTIQFATTVASVAVGGDVTLNVTRTGGIASSVTVHYATANGTAISGTDYTAAVGDLTFGKSQTTLPLVLHATAHGPLVEANPKFTVALSNPGSGGTLGARTTATVTILESAAGVKFGAASYAVSEGLTTKLVTIVRTGNLTNAVNVNVDCASTHATCPAAPVTIAAGKTLGTYSVTIIRDHVHTGNLTVNLSLSSGDAYVGTPGTVPLTITDVDPAAVVQFSVAAVSYHESDPTGFVQLTVKRVGGAPGAQVSFQTFDGTATQPTDYSETHGTLTFGSETTLPVQVHVPVNPTPAADGTFTVKLSNPAAGAALGAITTATVKIVHGDAGIQFVAAKYTVKELSPQILVSVKRVGNRTSPPTVTANIDCTSGNATSPANYACPASVMIPAGKLGATFPVTIAHDGVHTGNLTVNIALTTSPDAYLASPSSTVLTIIDAEPASQLAFSSAAYMVSDAAGTRATITVKRTGVLTGQVAVHYATSDGTAVAGDDYGETTGTLTFSGTGDNVKTFLIPIYNGGATKLTVKIDLSAPTGAGATLGLAHSVLTITSSVTNGVIQFQAPAVGVSQTAGTVALTVTRDSGIGTASVFFATTDGTAAQSTDYTFESGFVTFTAGVKTATITIPITDHSPTTGPAKSFSVVLADPSGGTNLGAQATATVWIDEGQTD